MNKIMSKFGSSLLLILLLPILLPLAVCVLIYIPFDYIKYRNTQFYKDTKAKYVWLAGVSYCTTLYEAIKKAHLSIQFVQLPQAPNSGYFIYKNYLIINDYGLVAYDDDIKAWTVEIDDDYVPIENQAKEDIKECNEFMQKQVVEKAVIIIDDDTLCDDDFSDAENIKVLLSSKENLTEVLQKFVENN